MLIHRISIIDSINSSMEQIHMIVVYFLKSFDMNRLFVLIMLLSPILLFCQNPERFQKEYDVFLEKDTKMLSEEGSLSTDCLFVGSSSIRFWTSLPDDYTDVKLLNRGFGGSQMSDLLAMRETLISKYKPKKIFIYEGDNDIADGEHIAEILYETEQLLAYIFDKLPEADVYLLAAKPSIQRWGFLVEYQELNREFLKLSLMNDQVHFIDIWTPMIDDDGEVLQDIFIRDNLHMNNKGYDIWRKILAPYVYE